MIDLREKTSRNVHAHGRTLKHIVQFLPERIEKFALRHLADDLPALNKKSFPDAAGNADIGFSRFSGPVYRASHNSHFNVERIILDKRLDLVCKTDQVDLSPSACGT